MGFLLHGLRHQDGGSLLLFLLEGGEVVEIGEVAEAVIFPGLVGLGLGNGGELRKGVHFRCFVFAGFLLFLGFLLVGVSLLEQVVEGPIVDSEFEGVDGVLGFGDPEAVAGDGMVEIEIDVEHTSIKQSLLLLGVDLFGVEGEGTLAGEGRGDHCEIVLLIMDLELPDELFLGATDTTIAYSLTLFPHSTTSCEIAITFYDDILFNFNYIQLWIECLDLIAFLSLYILKLNCSMSRRNKNLSVLVPPP